ncbi:MAG: L,D-transpeptidase family protein, partial [Woeseiaceae bacterium]
YRFERTGNGLELGHDGYMSIGQRGIRKEKAWDRRTPLGIYFVVDQLDTSRMHEQYGVTAFPLDYPNTWDRRHNRTGDGIWVHGVPPGGELRPPRDTDGCIALPNEDLRKLENRFVPLATPVIVTREMRWRSAADIAELGAELKQAIARWAEDYGNANLHGYLSTYSNDFSYRGMKLNEWASFRVQMLKMRGKVSVGVDDLLLLADPEEPGLFLSRFREVVTSGEGRAATIKRLYWRRADDGSWKIVAEDNG